MKDIPDTPGSYGLFLRMRSPAETKVGALGAVVLPAGEYIYLGSAHGPGGLRARLSHHRYGGRSEHWHVDYLRAVSEPTGCFYTPYNQNSPQMECRWSKELAQLPGAVIPQKGFGASDCRSGCAAHLVCFPRSRTRHPIRFLEYLLAEVQWQPAVKICVWRKS